MTDTILGFDPLEINTDTGGLDRIIAQEAVKREVSNILKSYTGYFDIFSELLQNALDALDHRSSLKKFHPKIWIDIDLSNSRVRVSDNGIGMGLAEVKFCFRPNVSFKNKKVSRGHKGVGATFIAYGYSSVRLQTKKENIAITGQLRNGRQWAEDGTDSYQRPLFEQTSFHAPELDHEESGTAIEVLIGPHQRPQLQWLNATSASQWLDILRMKTPLGGVYLTTTSRQSVAEIFLSVTDLAGTQTSVTGSNIDYYYPHEIPILKKVEAVRDIEAAVTGIKGDPTTRLQRLPDNFRRLDAVYDIWTKEQILGDAVLTRNLDEDQRVLIEKHSISIYGCFVSSAKMWSSFQKDILRVRASAVLLRGGLQMASDFMPQGDLNVIPLTSTIGYQANTHIVVHLVDGNPDMGRKVFQPEVKTLADELARRTVDVFKGYLSLMREDTGAPTILSSRELWSFMKAQEEHVAKNPLEFKAQNGRLSMISEPQSEQDVVALFHELLGLGVLRGFGIYATSESEKYDCVFYSEINDRSLVYSETQPLGASESSLTQGQSPPWVLEYKYDSDSLVADFNKERKFTSDVRLLVCWSIGEKTKAEYQLRSLLVGDEGSTRAIFGTTHAVFQEREKRFDIICLQELLSFLHDPIGEAARQRQVYG